MNFVAFRDILVFCDMKSVRNLCGSNLEVKTVEPTLQHYAKTTSTKPTP